MFSELSQQTLDLITKVDVFSRMQKATISQGSNLNAFDLRGPALQLYPVLTPLRNRVPREVSDRGDLATRWKAITGVNTTNMDMGLSPGQRSREMQITEQDYVASYAGIGLEASIDWEAIWAGGRDFDNKATVVQSLLRAVMIGEENLILQGNASLALGVPAAPTIVASAGGAFPSTTNLLAFVVALTPRGLANSSIAAGVPGVVTQVNKDATTVTFGGGASNVSAASAAITNGGNGTITATCPFVKGAAGYAWYLGTSAANAILTAITTVNKAVIIAAGAGTQTASQITTDNSTNALVFDGFITQALKANSGAYFASLDGTGFTADNANGLVEIDTALQSFWDNKRLSPTDMWLNSQEARNANKKLVSGGGTPIVRLTMDANGEAKPEIMGGASLGKYWNKFTQQFVNVRIHPNITAGTMLFTADEIPYPLSGVSTPNLIRCRRDYYQIDWPEVARQYVYGVYADEVLMCRAPFSLGVIANIGNV